MTQYTRFPTWFYNLRVGRNDEQVMREVRAILRAGPAVLGLSEAIGYKFPDVGSHKLIRNTATPGRANLAAYVRDDFPVSKVRWIECHETWSRPHGPGQHWPREILTFNAAHVPMVVVHQPPRWTDNEYRSQLEGINKITQVMAPWEWPRWDEMTWKQRRQAKRRPRISIGDFNRAATDPGPGPNLLARRIRGHAMPQNRIDCSVFRGQADFREFDRPTRVNGVELKSDHPHALKVVFDIPTVWTE